MKDEAEQAMLKDRFGPKVRPIAYVCHVPRLTALAREYGYAIAIHGSLQRDLDLIAAPWSDEATDAETLVKAVCEIVGGFMLPNEKVLQKPHGRLAWIIHLGAGLYIDLSVMPRIPETYFAHPEYEDHHDFRFTAQPPTQPNLEE